MLRAPGPVEARGRSRVGLLAANGDVRAPVRVVANLVMIVVAVGAAEAVGVRMVGRRLVRALVLDVEDLVAVAVGVDFGASGAARVGAVSAGRRRVPLALHGSGPALVRVLAVVVHPVAVGVAVGAAVVVMVALRRVGAVIVLIAIPVAVAVVLRAAAVFGVA